MNKLSSNIIEIFPSIQGEGCYIGQKQLFIRLAGCNLECNYCDTNSSAQEFCKIYADMKNFKEIKNPFTCENLIEEIEKFNLSSFHGISFTGGEPLVHAEFLKNFLENFRHKYNKPKIFLETNGTLVSEMKKIAPYVDIVSMDIKIESSTAQLMPFEEHEKFIEILNLFEIEFFAKVVINQNIKKTEIELVKKLLKTSKRSMPLILQPMSEKTSEKADWAEKLMYIQDEFLKEIKDTRVIAQMHKYLGLQ
ncbi:MAG TPA: 7-carboxy-7-deazaguanine synthase QueE [Candidatus Gastranaerophilales bacterium]|nr:7-carboxy-7-deazaguanine synthase QueE [Candidatus Gastranaerophilales bacterium]